MTGVNNTVAGAAVVSPFWLPLLEHSSSLAALLLPIAGLLWFVLQISYFVWSKRVRREN